MFKKLVLILVFSTFLLWLSGCIRDEPVEAVIFGIEIDQSSYKEEYDIESFSLKDIQIMVKKSDYTFYLIPLESSMLLVSDLGLLNIAGTHIVKVSYNGFHTNLRITLKDYSIPEDYSIKLLTDTSPSVAFISIKYGERLENLPLFTKDGYLFEGWYYSGELVKFPFYGLNNNIEFEAKWIIDEFDYEVKHNQIDGNYILITKYTGTSEDIVLPHTIEGLPVRDVNWDKFNDYTNYQSITLSINFTPYNYIKFLGDSIYVVEEHLELSSENGILYNKDKTTLWKYPEYKDNISFAIPSTVENIYVHAFENTVYIEEILIPNSVMYISFGAFKNSSLKSVVFEENSSVKEIGSQAFASTNITQIIIPKSVESIKDYAFYGNKKLSQITFEENSKLDLIGYGAFISTNISEFTISRSVTTISDFAFSHNSITKVIIEENSNLSIIGESAFFLSNIETIVIPKKVTHIGLNAFEEGTKYLVDDENVSFSSVNGILFNKDKSKLIRYPSSLTDNVYTVPKSVSEIDNYAFSVNEILNEILFEEGSELKKIDDFAFFWATKLEKITLPDSVTYIGQHAFNNTSIKIKYLPNNIEEIGESAFCNHVADEVFLPASLRKIGNGAFFDVVSFYIDENNPFFSVVDGVLYNKRMTELILYPNKSLKTEYYIPDTVELIRTDAFQRGFNLQTITITSGKKSIQDYAFSNMYVLNRLEILGNSDVIEIDGKIFHNIVPNIYVDNSLFEAYTNDENWSIYKEQIFLLEE